MLVSLDIKRLVTIIHTRLTNCWVISLDKTGSLEDLSWNRSLSRRHHSLANPRPTGLIATEPHITPWPFIVGTPLRAMLEYASWELPVKKTIGSLFLNSS